MISRCRIVAALTLMLMASVLVHSQQGATKIDSQRSRLLVKAFKSGFFSGFAHDHEIAAPIASGSIDPQNRRVELQVNVQQMKVLDPKLEADKRAEVQATMLSEKVLDPNRYPAIAFVSRSVEARPDGSYRVEGDLTLHGVTRTIVVPVQRRGDAYVGKSQIKQSEFGMKPISLFGGTVKVKDVVEVSFEIASKSATGLGN